MGTAKRSLDTEYDSGVHDQETTIFAISLNFGLFRDIV